MKPSIFIIPIVLLLASCASKSKPGTVTIVPESTGRILKSGETAQVRLGETIKAYPVGRYTDPRRSGVMHEAHTVYRVEKSPRWNLTRPAGAATMPVPPASTSAPSQSELTVELNRQRQATQAVIQGGQIVSGKLTEMTAALQQNRVLAGQNAEMRKDLEEARRRLAALEAAFLERSPEEPEPAPRKDDIPW